MRTRVLVSLVLALATALSARAQQGASVSGSGVLGTPVDMTFTATPGDIYVLYLSPFSFQSTPSLGGQLLGIGPIVLPIKIGFVPKDGVVSLTTTVPNIPALAELGYLFFEMETVRFDWSRFQFEPTGVSPGAFYLFRSPDATASTRLAIDPVVPTPGAPLKLHLHAQPKDFVIGFVAPFALPIAIPDGFTLAIGPVPTPFTGFDAFLDDHGDLTMSTSIPNDPSLVGTNLMFQCQTFKVVIFPPSITPRDTSQCLLLNVQ